MAVSYKLESITVGPIETNCMLLMNEDTKDMIIVDPGDDSSSIIQKIKSMSGNPKSILLTHGHSDHIMAVEDLQKSFRELRVFASEADCDMLVNPSTNSGFEYRRFHVVPDVLLKGGEKLTLCGFSIEVISTPGHTAGSLCYYLPDEKLLFSGDTLFCESYGRTDFATGSDAEMQKSLEYLKNRIPDDVRVFPGHMAFTSMAHEKRCNPGMA